MIDSTKNNHSFISEKTFHTQTQVSNNNSPPSIKIESIANQQTELTRLPVEVKQKIAFKLDLESYDNLRLTSKKMSEDLPATNEILTRLQSTRPGELKEVYKKLTNEKICIDILSEKGSQETYQTFNNIKAVQHMYFNDVTFLGTNYFLDKNLTSHCPEKHNSENGKTGLSDDEIYCNIFIKLDNEIKKHIDKKMIIYPMVQDNKSRYVSGPKRASLFIFKNSITPKILDIIFKSFDSLLNERNEKDRFLMAICASRIKEYWQDNLPGTINKNDLDNCVLKYPSLFYLGKVISEQLSRRNPYSDILSNDYFSDDN